MKAQEYLKGLRGKDGKALKEELVALRREQFNLRMQAATGQGSKSNLVRDVRKKIARIKTVIAEQVKSS